MMPGNDNFFVPNINQYTRLMNVNSDFAVANNIQSTVVSANNVQQYLERVNMLMQQTRHQKVREKEMNLNNYTDIYSNEYFNGPRPLTSDLGNYRILRTSTLVAVPEVCCTV
jgi:hypothetical protein